MATDAVYWPDSVGLTLYWYPAAKMGTVGVDWTTYRTQAVDGDAVGSYYAELSDANGATWFLFNGATAPSSGAEAIGNYTVTGNTAIDNGGGGGGGSPPSIYTTYDRLLERIGHYLFGVRTGFSGDQTDDIVDCMNDGLRRVYAAHEWSFFRPIQDVVTTAPYATGTVTVASGVVTLTSGTFPSWAAAGVFQVNNNYYSVATRDSDTQITLDDTSLTVASASSYQLARPEIPMDASFDAVDNDSDLTYYPSPNCWYPPVRWTHDATIRHLEASNPEFDRPVLYSVRNVEFDPTIGSRKVLAMYPTPNQVYTLRVPMVLRPVMIDADNPYPIGGEMLSQVIIEACLASAEHNFEEREHVHEKRFMELIGLAIRNDQDRSSATSLGPDAPRGERSRFNVFDSDYRAREQRIGSLTLGGDTL